jgi:hypothetical protein
MATYKLIASYELSSGASDITFSSIPQTYTDLVLRMSTRMSSGNGGLFVRPNNASTGLNSRRIYNEGTGFGSDNLTSNYWFAYNNGSWASSNSFASTEFYITDYTSTALNKVASTYTVTMNYSSTRYISFNAQKLNSTSAITSIVIYPEGGGTFQTNSGFYLYGISKA